MLLQYMQLLSTDLITCNGSARTMQRRSASAQTAKLHAPAARRQAVQQQRLQETATNASSIGSSSAMWPQAQAPAEAEASCQRQQRQQQRANMSVRQHAAWHLRPARNIFCNIIVKPHILWQCSNFASGITASRARHTCSCSCSKLLSFSRTTSASCIFRSSGICAAMRAFASAVLQLSRSITRCTCDDARCSSKRQQRKAAATVSSGAAATQHW